MHLYAKWLVGGVIMEYRQLKTKTGDIFGHELKVASIGQTFAVRVDKAQADKFGAGQAIECEGTFSMYNNAPQLTATDIWPAGSRDVAPKPAADGKAADKKAA